MVSLTAQYHTLHARLLDSCAPLPLDGGSIKMAITDVDLSPLSEEDRAFLTEYCSSDTDGERELDESVRALIERYPFQVLFGGFFFPLSFYCLFITRVTNVLTFIPDR